MMNKAPCRAPRSWKPSRFQRVFAGAEFEDLSVDRPISIVMVSVG
jgi:hypothetical protein